MQPMHQAMGRLAARLGNTGRFGRLAAQVLAETVENAVGAVPTAIVGNVINDDNWEGGFQFGNVMQNVALEVGQSVATGLAMSQGMALAGRVRSGAIDFIRGPRLGADPSRLRLPEHLLDPDLTPNAYRSAREDFIRRGGTAEQFDVAMQRERAMALRDYLEMHRGNRTEADFDTHVRDNLDARRAEFAEMNRGRHDADFDAELGREAAYELSQIEDVRTQRSNVQSELPDNVRDVPVSIVSRSEFARLTGSISGDVTIVVRDGQAHLVVREGTPASAVREHTARLASMVEPGTGGRTRNPADSLPRDLRNRVPTIVNDQLDAGTVQVHYESHEGVIVGVWVETGPLARAVDIQMHVGTIRSMRRLQGISGQVNRVLDRIRSWFGHYRPAPGTRAFEAKLEVEKLPRIIEEQAAALRSTLDPAEQMRIAVEIEHLRAQLDHHTRFVDSIEVEPGRGYVAAERLSAESVETRIRQLPEDTQQRIRDLDSEHQVELLAHSRLLQSIPADSQNAFIDAWQTLRNVETENHSFLHSLMARAERLHKPGRFLRNLATIAGQLEGPYPHTFLHAISRMQDSPHRRTGSVESFVNAVSKVVTHEGADRNAIGHLLDLATRSESRLRFIGSLNSLLRMGLSNQSLRALVWRGQSMGPDTLRRFMANVVGFMPKTAGRQGDSIDFVRRLDQIRDAVILGASSIQMTAPYLERAGTLVDAVVRAARQPDPELRAHAHRIMDYTKMARHDERVASDLMTAGGQLAGLSIATVNERLGRFASRLGNDPPRLTTRRENWATRLQNAEAEYRAARQSGGNASTREFADSIARATSDSDGWTDAHRAMMLRRRSWIQLVAESLGKSDVEVIQDLEPMPFAQERHYDAFRRRLRNKLLAQVFADGYNRPNYDLLNRALTNFPGSSAKGALFAHYMQQRFGRGRRKVVVDLSNVTNPRIREMLARAQQLFKDWGFHDESVFHGLQPINGPLTQSGLALGPNGKGKPIADDMAHVISSRRHLGGPSDGPIFIDYKAGPGAFSSSQFRAYVEAMTPPRGNGKIRKDGQEFGLVYIADSEAHAVAAVHEAREILRQMAATEGSNFSQRQLSIHFAYDKGDGTLGWVRLWD